MEMLSHLSTRLQYQHQALVDLIDGLSIEMIRRQIIPGKWSIFENIIHLQCYQHTFINRVNEIIEKDNPFFDRYTAESDPLFLENCGKTTREAMHDLISFRKEIAELINGFTETVLNRTGTHPYFGTMSLLQWINFFLLHEAHHLFTILKLRAALQKEMR